MLYGFDISHHNGEVAVINLADRYPANSSFFMIKASEGKTFIDPNWEYNAKKASEAGICVGLYHYCRAEKNNPEDEAHHFCNVVSSYIGKAILAADYEEESLKIGQDWLLRFCTRVYEITGVRPMVYIQYANIKDYPKLAENNFGLWVAKWGAEPINVSPWKFKAMWQTTNRFNGEKLDSNIFYGDKNTWLKYAESNLREDTNKPIEKPIEEISLFESAVVEVLVKYGLLHKVGD